MIFDCDNPYFIVFFSIVIATVIVIAIATVVEVRLLAAAKVAFMGGEARWGAARRGATLKNET